jgi:hypothetical protein
MAKINLLVSRTDLNGFCSDWFFDAINDNFNLIFHEDNNSHTAKDTVCITNMLGTNSWYQCYIDCGYKLIVDNLWEMPAEKEVKPGFYLSNKNWFWYNESLWYKHLGYHAHIPNPDISKNGLLLMHLKKLHRDWIFERLDLNKLLFSYVEAGFTIDGDVDSNDGNWQRHFNEDWYNSTAFSIVAETTMWRNDPLFITEKTFKPIAFQHPFIIFGQPGVLQYLQKQGFETFENIFDESYDVLTEIDVRITHIADQINNYSHKNYDLVTFEKLRHNKELFFNTQLIKDKIRKEIVEPIVEYAET